MSNRFACATLVLILLVASGCTTPSDGVRQFGAMREVMRDGQTQPRVSLAAAVRQPHAYAVGALEGLHGEVTISDGSVWVARVGDDGPFVTGPHPSAADQATLLTVAHVPEWRSFTVTDSVAGPGLERFVEAAARESGVDTSVPFPFIIEGVAGEIAIHVINGYCPVATDPSSVNTEPWRWSSRQAGNVTIVGFHAPGSAGVMTHHGTALHAHAIVEIDGSTVTGHVDEVRVSAGMSIRVPGESWPHRR